MNNLDLALEHLTTARRGLEKSGVASEIAAALLLIDQAIKFIEKHKAGNR